MTTQSEDLAQKIRMLRNYGSTVKYQHDVVGLNSRLDELQAAFLRSKLRHLEEWNGRRKAFASFYLERLQHFAPDIELPTVPEWADPVWHLFVVRHPRRDDLQRFLAERGVSTQIHYPIPPHLSGAYAGQFRPGQFPIAEKLARECLSLPIGPHLLIESAEYVVECASEFCTKTN